MNEHEFAFYLATDLGQEVVRLLQGEVTIETKQDGTRVTNIDRAIDTYIRREISRQYTLDGLLTEETEDSQTRLQKERVWICDSIDGTEEMIAYLSDPSRNGFAVHVGFAFKGVAYIGVVHEPITKKTYFTVQHCGAWLFQDNAYPIQLRVTDNPALSLGVSPRNYPIAQQQELEPLEQITSVGVHMCRVAAGHPSCYVSLSGTCKQWDLCAPAIILEQAGGKITDLNQQPIMYNLPALNFPEGVLAAPAQYHQQILQRIQK